jgi:hypothetical protein
MKKQFYTILGGLLIACMASCNQAPTMDTATMDRKIDSSKQSLIDKANDEITAKCEERKATEVGIKADSIFKSMKAI